MGMTAFERGLIGLVTLALIVGATLHVRRDAARYARLVGLTMLATFVLIVLGAYVRLSDAGLGCPDWPGCYGDFTPHQAREQIGAAETQMPSGPVTMAKAWKEMLHRYLAMVTGALIAAIAASAWLARGALPGGRALPSAIAVLVVFQAALGAWTVTMLLKPAIVTGHLLGGLALLALLVWLRLRNAVARIIPGSPPRILAGLALVALVAQVALGGWVSTNYAALACTDFPLCRGELVPQGMHFEHAFHVFRELGRDPAGALLPVDALVAIHWTHRAGAVVASGMLGWLAWRLWRDPAARGLGAGLAALLTAQLLLGVGNVVFSLPLPLAVLHNAGAAALLAMMVVVNYRLRARGPENDIGRR
jgi:cytochrome c oxidase assembly protein subunit 15